MSRRKKKIPVFKKHFVIPLVLCGLILIAGICMTLLNQGGKTTVNHYRIGQYILNGEHTNYISGPQTIVLALVMALFIAIYWYKTEKENPTP